MHDKTRNPALLRVAALSPSARTAFELVPDRAACAAMAADLGLRGLRKLRFAGTLCPEGRADWRLDAGLGATVTQDCVVTLAPVTTRIDETVTRRFLKDWPPPGEQGDEVEMPEDESIDPLGPEIDLEAVMAEALTLALPLYPRAPGAEPAPSSNDAPGGGPEENTGRRPFAALATLKKKLEEDGD